MGRLDPSVDRAGGSELRVSAARRVVLDSDRGHHRRWTYRRDRFGERRAARVGAHRERVRAAHLDCTARHTRVEPGWVDVADQSLLLLHDPGRAGPRVGHSRRRDRSRAVRSSDVVLQPERQRRLDELPAPGPQLLPSVQRRAGGGLDGVERARTTGEPDWTDRHGPRPLDRRDRPDGHRSDEPRERSAGVRRLHGTDVGESSDLRLVRGAARRHRLQCNRLESGRQRDARGNL